MIRKALSILVRSQEDFMLFSLEHLDGALGKMLAANFREFLFQKLFEKAYARANRLTITRVIAA
jgi:hypothetical protein